MHEDLTTRFNMLSSKDQLKRFFRLSSPATPKFEPVHKPVHTDYGQENDYPFSKRFSDNSFNTKKKKNGAGGHKHAKSHSNPFFNSGTDHITTQDLYIEQRPIVNLPASPLEKVTKVTGYKQETGNKHDTNIPTKSRSENQRLPHIPSKFKANLSPPISPKKDNIQFEPETGFGNSVAKIRSSGYETEEEYDSDEDKELFTPIGELKDSLLPHISPLPPITLDDFSNYRLSKEYFPTPTDDMRFAHNIQNNLMGLNKNNSTVNDPYVSFHDKDTNSQESLLQDDKSMSTVISEDYYRNVIEEESNRRESHISYHEKKTKKDEHRRSDHKLHRSQSVAQTPRKYPSQYNMNSPYDKENLTSYYEWDSINANINLIQESMKQWDQRQLNDEIEQLSAKSSQS